MEVPLAGGGDLAKGSEYSANDPARARNASLSLIMAAGQGSLHARLLVRHAPHSLKNNDANFVEYT